MEILIFFIATIALFFTALFLARASGNKKRRNELAGIVEPLGFDALSKFDDEFISDFYRYHPTLGFKINITAVCVREQDRCRNI